MPAIKHFLLALIPLTLIMGSCSIDEEPTPIITAKIESSSEIVIEGETTGNFTITLSEALQNPVDIQLEIAGTASNETDYIKIADKITIPVNQTQHNISISAIDDNEEEELEEITITLVSSDNESVIFDTLSMATMAISDPSASFVPLPGEIRSYLVNSNATSETVALFYNLKAISRTKFIIGQQDAFSSFYNGIGGESDIKKTTGSNPGLLGSDFMFITDDKNDENPTNWFFQQEKIIVNDVIEAYNQGMVNIFVWHLREPYQGEEFYTGNMSDFQKNNALKSILPGAANHEYYKDKLRKVAKIANALIGDDGKKIPIIFRPFHEFDGDWFWWGKPYCTADEFKTIWRFTVDYLTNDLGVDNMLFAFSPDSKLLSEDNYLSRYPGDDYVDILGMDNYRDFSSGNQTELDKANYKLQIISNLASTKVKIAALTESCDFRTDGQPDSDFYSKDLYGVLTKNKVEIGFMMFWSNNQNTYCTPPPNQRGDADDFLTFVNKPDVLLANDLPALYALPIQ